MVGTGLNSANALWGNLFDDPERDHPMSRKRKQVVKNRSIMLKYFYNKEIGFLEVDPEFVELGLKYAQKKAIDSIRIRTLNLNYGHRYKIDFQLIACQDFIRRFWLNGDFKIVNLKDG